ncbi:hypothetical protein NPIL_348481 [Nephila pilipes]|uniref:Uncharacterized protein n=1 Tax=Nephila pilipes TaxID=299642 RepID=A0A8X6TRM6_NEPPI|nr:hypothetical protein NPIL_348481 [Nephila pilipes]
MPQRALRRHAAPQRPACQASAFTKGALPNSFLACSAVFAQRRQARAGRSSKMYAATAGVCAKLLLRRFAVASAVAGLRLLLAVAHTCYVLKKFVCIKPVC